MLLQLLNTLKYTIKKTLIKPRYTKQIPFTNWKIVKGDTVQIISGFEKKKTGKVTKVFRKTNRVMVKGINLRRKMITTSAGQKEIVRKPGSIHVSNVGLYDHVAKRATRVRFAYHPATNEKIRISKRTGIILNKPNRNRLKRSKRSAKKQRGQKDTPSLIANKVTYQGEDFQKIKKEFEQFIAEKEKREKLLVFTH